MEESQGLIEATRETDAFIRKLELSPIELNVAMDLTDAIQKRCNELIKQKMLLVDIPRPITVVNAAFAIALMAGSTVQEKTGRMDL